MVQQTATHTCIPSSKIFPPNPASILGLSHVVWANNQHNQGPSQMQHGHTKMGLMDHTQAEGNFVGWRQGKRQRADGSGEGFNSVYSCIIQCFCLIPAE